MRKREAEKMQEMESIKKKRQSGRLCFGFPTAARLWRGFPVLRDKHAGLLKVENSSCSCQNDILSIKLVRQLQATAKGSDTSTSWNEADHAEMKWSVRGEPRYIAKGKPYTSGNSHVISTVHEQTVEQRASKETPPFFQSYSEAKPVKTRQMCDERHTAVLVYGLAWGLFTNSTNES